MIVVCNIMHQLNLIPFDRLFQFSGPWGSKECSSSILSLIGGSSKGAPIDRHSLTA